jgi:hypothetical protein
MRMRNVYSYDRRRWATKAPNYEGQLGVGDLLSTILGNERVYVYRWVPDWAGDELRNGDYVLLDPDEGRHYGGPRGHRLTARVSAAELEYQQGNEFKYRGRTRRVHVTR